jgi:phosphoribosylamine--glycine ligase
VAECVNIGVEDGDKLVEFAKANNVEFAVVGPEAPLVKGLVDSLEAAGIKAFGPVAAGARMEGSKRFAKDVMLRANVPTGASEVFSDAQEAKAALSRFGAPVVIKADGLAAGKGVVVAETIEEAEAAIDDMLVSNKCGNAGAKVLVEEFLHGEECSVLAMVDGERAVLLPSSQDHKRIFDGDKGPNTGGMGAYSPAPVVKSEMLPEIKEKIILPVVRELSRRGIVYRGILYAGLMVNENPDGPSPNSTAKNRLAISGSKINVVEFNSRFGDPETEAVLPRLGGNFARTLLNAASGCLGDGDIVVRPEVAATVILSSGGYPGDYEKGFAITGIGTDSDDSVVFHCGTKQSGGDVLTAGGRVLSVTGFGADLRKAVDCAYERADTISFEGKFCRRDIARRAFERKAD